MHRYPRDTRVHLALAEQLLSDGAIAAAVGHYLTLVELDPENALALNNVAWLSVDEHPERALDYATRAVALNQSASVLHTQGRALLRNGRPVEAVAVLTRATQADPENL